MSQIPSGQQFNSPVPFGPSNRFPRATPQVINPGLETIDKAPPPPPLPPLDLSAITQAGGNIARRRQQKERLGIELDARQIAAEKRRLFTAEQDKKTREAAQQANTLDRQSRESIAKADRQGTLTRQLEREDRQQANRAIESGAQFTQNRFAELDARLKQTSDFLTGTSTALASDPEILNTREGQAASELISARSEELKQVGIDIHNAAALSLLRVRDGSLVAGSPEQLQILQEANADLDFLLNGDPADTVAPSGRVSAPKVLASVRAIGNVDLVRTIFTMVAEAGQAARKTKQFSAELQRSSDQTAEKILNRTNTLAGVDLRNAEASQTFGIELGTGLREQLSLNQTLNVESIQNINTGGLLSILDQIAPSNPGLTRGLRTVLSNVETLNSQGDPIGDPISAKAAANVLVKIADAFRNASLNRSETGPGPQVAVQGPDGKTTMQDVGQPGGQVGKVLFPHNLAPEQRKAGLLLSHRFFALAQGVATTGAFQASLENDATRNLVTDYVDRVNTFIEQNQQEPTVTDLNQIAREMAAGNKVMQDRIRLLQTQLAAVNSVRGTLGIGDRVGQRQAASPAVGGPPASSVGPTSPADIQPPQPPQPQAVPAAAPLPPQDPPPGQAGGAGLNLSNLQPQRRLQPVPAGGGF